MKTGVMWSSNKMDWSTPQDFFDKLNEEFHFSLGPCADDLNHKCDKYYTEEQDGLKQDWSGETVFCNLQVCCYASPCEDRHKVVSRLHLQPSRSPIYQGQIKVRRGNRTRTVSINGGYIQRHRR